MRLDESYKSAEQFTQEQMQDVLRVNKIRPRSLTKPHYYTLLQTTIDEAAQEDRQG